MPSTAASARLDPMPRNWRPYTAVAALALLLGPVRAYVVPAATDALFGHELATEAIASAAAALLLVPFAGKRSSVRTRNRSRAIWLLFLPQLVATVARSHVLAFFPQHELKWGVTTGLSLAAPLWLALLSALQLVSAEVPRAVAGAAIAALATVPLSLQTSAYAIEPNQVPALVFALTLALLTVYSWAYAAPALAAEQPARSAIRLLLLRAAADACFSLALERTSLHGVAWRGALVLLALDAALTAAAMFLWFWLLSNLRLQAFSFHPVAIWTASVLAGIAAFGPANWRLDLSAVLCLAALWFGLRARVADDRPIALELP